MTHAEYYTRKFQIVLLVPPLLALCSYQVILGERDLQSWDFAKGGAALSQWQFSVPYTEVRSNGTVFPRVNSGPLATITGLKIPADHAAEVRVRLRAINPATGTEVVPSLWLHWAASPMPDSPSFEEMSCPFKRAFTSEPEHIYYARPAGSKGDLWSGVIQSFRIVVILPKPCPDGCQIELSGIEILE